jgi:OPA family glycerol-3-phosphate transporter-like MFS transporter/OPA family sugar phosphate sensor protein UhpC-like MFS transporter
MEGTHTKVEEKTSSAEYRAFLREKVFRNPVIWTLAFANFFVYVVRFAVLDWGPKFLQEARGLSLSDAGWSVATFEIFGIIGMLVAGWVTDKWFKGRAHRTCVFCMLGAAVFMAIFYFLPTSAPMSVLIIVLAMAGFFIYGPQALIGIAAANQATKSAAATANGVTGIFGYLSVFVSGLGVGAMVDWINRNHAGQGWDAVFIMMIGMAIVGMLIFLAMWKVKATGYDEQKA